MSAQRSEKPSNNSTAGNLPRHKRVRAFDDDQLLYSREQVCRMLGGIHKSTIIRYEEAGRLRPVKLNPGKTTAKVYYRRADVFTIVEG